jgi:hypothetical protein
MGTVANVRVIKPQAIYYADVATDLPAITGTLGSTLTMGAGWTDAGFIDPEGKVKITFSSNIIQVRGMGVEGNLKSIKTQKKAMLEFSGFEKTIANLALAIGGSTLASNELPDGGDSEVSYKAWAFVEDGLVYHFKKLGQVEDVEDEVADDAAGLVQFKLETHVEEAASAGKRQWNILERTAA